MLAMHQLVLPPTSCTCASRPGNLHTPTMPTRLHTVLLGANLDQGLDVLETRIRTVLGAVAQDLPLPILVGCPLPELTPTSSPAPRVSSVPSAPRPAFRPPPPFLPSSPGMTLCLPLAYYQERKERRRVAEQEPLLAPDVGPLLCAARRPLHRTTYPALPCCLTCCCCHPPHSAPRPFIALFPAPASPHLHAWYHHSVPVHLPFLHPTRFASSLLCPRLTHPSHPPPPCSPRARAAAPPASAASCTRSRCWHCPPPSTWWPPC